MTQPMWSPDGTWVGGSSPVEHPEAALTATPQDPVERSWRLLGCGCLTLVGLGLLLPAFFLAVFAAISALDEDADTALATVVAVGPGTDDAGQRRPYCYTVEYVVETPRTHRTCDTLSVEKVVVRPGTGERDWEGEAAREARFAREHPVGSTVKLLYEVENPDRVRGPISETGFSRSGGGRTPAALGATGAVLCLVAIFFALRTARRLGTRRRTSTTGGADA